MEVSLISSGVRFAPSPTGRFHVGNLRTAWVSHALARVLGEPWIIRVEDIDTARVSREHQSIQIADLQSIGLVADQIVIQSDRYARHLELFHRARAEGRVYPCDCSRKDVLESLSQILRAPHAPIIEYSGHCRHRTDSSDLAAFHPTDTLAWRWKINAPVEGVDSEIGHHDAIVARTDARGEKFVPGYHWACAIDDADGNYRLLVRAWDLASVDEIQSDIRRWCRPSQDRNHFSPLVFHTSIVTRDDGGRLEKRTQGVTLAELQASGISSENLISKFQKSFDLTEARQQITSLHRPIGETLKSVSLQTLMN